MLIKLKNYKRFQKFIYFGLIISFQILIVFCSFSWAKNVRHLNVQEIVFSTTKIIKADEYSDIFDKLIGSNYNDINLNMLTEELGDHPYVFASRISYHFPGKIYVEIVERKPIAILNTNPMIMLDAEGYVLPNLENILSFSLPTLSNFNLANELYPLGEKVLSINVKRSIKWLKKMQKDYPHIYDDLSEIRQTSEDNIELILSEEPTKILLGSDEILEKIEILNQFSMNLNPKHALTNFFYLDMRYNNQIIAKERRS
tara:strand:- start:20586 stop:21356 length:771 start_codon:yes stop_codon:yes gene_type:complete